MRLRVFTDVNARQHEHKLRVNITKKSYLQISKLLQTEWNQSIF
jgi:hypothetical protein